METPSYPKRRQVKKQGVFLYRFEKWDVERVPEISAGSRIYFYGNWCAIEGTGFHFSQHPTDHGKQHWLTEQGLQKVLESVLHFHLDTDEPFPLRFRIIEINLQKPPRGYRAIDDDQCLLPKRGSYGKTVL